MLYDMVANFSPTQQPKNGYIGRADITVAEAIKLRGIAVFLNEDNTGLKLRFPSFGEKRTSYIYPANKEAYGEMVQIVTAAVQDRKAHTAHVSGKLNPPLSIKGYAVSEEFADARFTIEVEGFCTLNGITTREAQYRNRQGSFVAVNTPTLSAYINDAGRRVYPSIFEGLKCTYKGPDGMETTKDFGELIVNMVRNERKRILEHTQDLGLQKEYTSSHAGQISAQTHSNQDRPAPEKRPVPEKRSIPEKTL